MIDYSASEVRAIFEREGMAGFDGQEARECLMYYVCPVCYGQLTSFLIPGTHLHAVACVEHGNVEQIGRITANTVQVLMLQATARFWDAVRNLDDLWGGLIPPPLSEQDILKDLGF